ncbi:MAG: DUF892 family protein [Nitrososphaera sp.]
MTPSNFWINVFVYIYNLNSTSHLQETRQQQKRLEDIITNLGAKPTEENAGLSILTSPKSIAADTENKATTAEWELKYAEQDAIIENAEAVGYDMLIQWAIKVNVENVIPILMQNLQKEEDMRMSLRANTPKLFAESWPRIEEEADAEMMSEDKENRRK